MRTLSVSKPVAISINKIPFSETRTGAENKDVFIRRRIAAMKQITETNSFLSEIFTGITNDFSKINVENLFYHSDAIL